MFFTPEQSFRKLSANAAPFARTRPLGHATDWRWIRLRRSTRAETARPGLSVAAAADHHAPRLSDRELLRALTHCAPSGGKNPAARSDPDCAKITRFGPFSATTGRRARAAVSRSRNSHRRCPAASNERETRKKAKIGPDLALFCQLGRSVCATQPAPTRVS